MAQHSPSFSAFSLVAGSRPCATGSGCSPWRHHDALPEPTRQTLLTLLGSPTLSRLPIKQPGLLAETLASDALTRPSAGPPMRT